MAIINCPECEKQCSDKALKCPHCGYPIANLPQQEVSSGIMLLQDKIQDLVASHQIAVALETERKTFKINLTRSGIKLLRPDYETIWRKIRPQLRPDKLRGFDNLIAIAKFEGDSKTEWQRQNKISPSGNLVLTTTDYIYIAVGSVGAIIAAVIVSFWLFPGLFRGSTRTYTSPVIDIISPASSDIITLSEYSRLDTGISYSQAVSIIGSSGTESSRVEIPGTPVTVSYSWQNSDGSNAMAIFQGDKLTSKAQFGLR